MKRSIIKIPAGASRRVQVAYLEARTLDSDMEQKFNVQFIGLLLIAEGRKS